MDLPTFVFTFSYYLINFLLSKIFFFKMGQFGRFSSMLSLLLYSIVGAFSGLIAKYVDQISFRMLSVFFLLNFFCAVLFIHSNSLIALVFCNLIRGYVMSVLSSISFIVIIKSLKKDHSYRRFLIFLTIFFALLLSLVIPYSLYEPFLMITTTLAFVFFFIIGENAESDLKFQKNILMPKNRFILKAVLIRFINSLIIAFIKPRTVIKILLLIVRIIKMLFIFTVKTVIFLIVIWNLINTHEKAGILFLIHEVLKYFDNVKSKKFLKASNRYLEGDSSIREAYDILTNTEGIITVESNNNINQIADIFSNLF